MPPDQPLGTKPRALPGWRWDLAVWALGSSGVHGHAWQGRLPEPELWGAVSPVGRRPQTRPAAVPQRAVHRTLASGSRLGPAGLSPGPDLWEALRKAASSVLGQRSPGAPGGSEAAWNPLWLEQLQKVSEARPKVRGASGQTLLSCGGAAKRADHGLQHGPPGGVARRVCSLSLTPSARDPAEPRAENAGEGPGAVPAKPTAPGARLGPALRPGDRWSLGRQPFPASLCVWPLTAHWLSLAVAQR